MLDLCKNCDLNVDSFVKNCQKSSTVAELQNKFSLGLWIRAEKYQLFHKTIHIAKESLLSGKPTLSTLVTGPTITTKLKKGTL